MPSRLPYTLGFADEAQVDWDLPANRRLVIDGTHVVWEDRLSGGFLLQSHVRPGGEHMRAFAISNILEVVARLISLGAQLKE